MALEGFREYMEIVVHKARLVILLASAFAAGSIAAARAESAPGYTVTRAVLLGAPDRWDYVVFDPPSHRIYVAHGDRIAVVDGHDGEILGEIDGMPGGTHGIGISTATGEGYTDDGKAGEAAVFDLNTLKVKSRIAVAPDADAIVFDGVSDHVFVIDGDPGKVSVIEPKSDTVVATIDGGGKLESAVSDNRGDLYVAGVEKRDVVRIDTRTNVVTAHWAIPDCASPHGVAIDVKTHRLFVSCVNSLLVAVDTRNGREVASVPIGKGTDAAAFDPKRRRVFSSNGLDGTLSVIQEETAGAFIATATIKTAVSGRTMSIDPDTGRLYIAAADTDPSPTPGGRPRPRPGTLKLLFLDPAR
jgi:DNA-binding beta-propeller fold protein YncE